MVIYIKHDTEKITLLVLEKLYSEYSFLEKDKNSFKEKYIIDISKFNKKEKTKNNLYNKSLANLYNELKKMFEEGKFVDVITNYTNVNLITDEIVISNFKFIDTILRKTDYEYSSEEICDILKIKKIDKLLYQLSNKEQTLIDTLRKSSKFLDSLLETYLVFKEDSLIGIQEEYYSDDIVTMYLKEINKYPLLSKDEEVELTTRYANGDMSAKEKLINHNLRLSPYIAKRYINKGIPFMDLIQEGNTGLIKAIDKFDVSKGNKLSTYAIWWIRQAVERCIQDNSRQIRIPVNQQEKYTKYMNGKDELKKELNRDPTIEELANRTKLSVNQIKIIERALNVSVISINERVNDDGDSELIDFIPSDYDMPETIIEKNTLKIEVTKLLENSKLNEREKDVLNMRFGLNNEFGIRMTLEEVAKILGVSRERVRQIEAKALKKLLYIKGIEEYTVYLDNPDKALDNLPVSRKRRYTKSKKSSINHGKEILRNDAQKKPLLENKSKLGGSIILEKNKKESGHVMKKEKVEEVSVIETVNSTSNYDENNNSDIVNESSVIKDEKNEEKSVKEEEIDTKKDSISNPRIRKNWKNLDECYSEYDRNLRNIACSKLDQRDQDLMHKRYGEDLINYKYNENITSKERQELYSRVLPKFERILAALSKKNNEEVKNEEAKENRIVKEDFITDKKTDIIAKENCDNILSIFNNPIFVEFAKTRPIKEFLVVSLVLGLGDIKSLSTSEIADILKIDKEKVDSIVKNSLYDLKIMLNKMIDVAIEEKCNSKEKTLVKTKLSNSEN